MRIIGQIRQTRQIGQTGKGRDSLAHLEIHSLAHLRNSLTYAPGKSLTCAPRCGGVVGWGGVGWGGIITFMFPCTHRHSNLIIFLAVLQTQAVIFQDKWPVGWGGVGWDNNVHVPVHPQAQQPHHLSWHRQWSFRISAYCYYNFTRFA